MEVERLEDGTSDVSSVMWDFGRSGESLLEESKDLPTGGNQSGQEFFDFRTSGVSIESTEEGLAPTLDIRVGDEDGRRESFNGRSISRMWL